MIIGYARTSTQDQVAGFEAQKRDLEAAGCTKIYAEQISSVADRPELEALLSFVREGDVVTVTKLDRLARSMRDLLSIVARIEDKGASLRILAMNLDTDTATGKLMLNVLGSVAEFERAMMLERQREGISKAKAAGKYTGRQPTAMQKTEEARKLLAEGRGVLEVAAHLEISRTSVWRISKALAAATPWQPTNPKRQSASA